MTRFVLAGEQGSMYGLLVAPRPLAKDASTPNAASLLPNAAARNSSRSLCLGAPAVGIEDQWLSIPFADPFSQAGPAYQMDCDDWFLHPAGLGVRFPAHHTTARLVRVLHEPRLNLEKDCECACPWGCPPLVMLLG